MKSEKKSQLKQVFDKVIKKSRAGVKYTHYVPRIVGSIDRTPNRKQVRLITKFLRGAPMRLRKKKVEDANDEAKKLRRENLAKKYPQRPYLCKQRGCELRNKKKGFCNSHQGLK